MLGISNTQTCEVEHSSPLLFRCVWCKAATFCLSDLFITDLAAMFQTSSLCCGLHRCLIAIAVSLFRLISK